MDIKKVQRKESKRVGVYVKTTAEYSAFMKEHKISPTKVFNEAVKELKESIKK